MADGSVCPDGYGFEFEESLRYMGPDGHGRRVPNTHVVGALVAHREALAREQGMVFVDQFDSAGARTYMDHDHLEYATAECKTLDQAVERAEVSEVLVEGVGAALVKSSGRNIAVGINQRVIDGVGNSFACHRSIGYDGPKMQKLAAPNEGSDMKLHRPARDMLIGHLLTRSFVTGTGYVKDGEYLFAQKITRIDGETEYGYQSYLYRCELEGDSMRVEDRCGDRNISPWALRMSLGSTAIALAVAQTPMADRFEIIARDDIAAIRRAAVRYNHCPVATDGQIRDWSEIEGAIRFQSQLAETFLSDEMGRYGDRPEELLAVARELREFCGDMTSVLRGDVSYAILADRADWAAKLDVIERGIQRDRALGKERQLGDEMCRKYDVGYDYIEVRKDPKDKKKIEVRKVGPAYKLRERGAFRYTPDRASVRRAMQHAPSGTRASLRSRLMRQYVASAIDWSCIRLMTQDGRAVPILLSNVRQTRLTAYQKRQTARAIER